MPTLSISTSYADGDVLFKSDLDDIKNGVQDFLNVTKIDSDNIQTGGVSSANIATGAVTATKIGASAVETAKINDSAVTTAKINDSAVTTAKINDSAVTTAKINDSAVTTAKINTAAVTQAKLGSANYGVSTNSTGTFSTTSTSHTAVTNASVTITPAAGRPVEVYLQSDGSGNLSYLGATNNSGISDQVSFLIKRGSTEIAREYLAAVYSSGAGFVHAIPVGSLRVLDTGAGSGSPVTYTVEARSENSTNVSARVYYAKLVAREV